MVTPLGPTIDDSNLAFLQVPVVKPYIEITCDLQERPFWFKAHAYTIYVEPLGSFRPASRVKVAALLPSARPSKGPKRQGICLLILFLGDKICMQGGQNICVLCVFLYIYIYMYHMHTHTIQALRSVQTHAVR